MAKQEVGTPIAANQLWNWGPYSNRVISDRVISGLQCILVYSENHIGAIFNIDHGIPILCCVTTDLGIFWYCSKDF